MPRKVAATKQTATAPTRQSRRLHAADTGEQSPLRSLSSERPRRSGKRNTTSMNANSDSTSTHPSVEASHLETRSQSPSSQSSYASVDNETADADRAPKEQNELDSNQTEPPPQTALQEDASLDVHEAQVVGKMATRSQSIESQASHASVEDEEVAPAQQIESDNSDIDTTLEATAQKDASSSEPEAQPLEETVASVDRQTSAMEPSNSNYADELASLSANAGDDDDEVEAARRRQPRRKSHVPSKPILCVRPDAFPFDFRDPYHPESIADEFNATHAPTLLYNAELEKRTELLNQHFKEQESIRGLAQKVGEGGSKLQRLTASLKRRKVLQNVPQNIFEYGKNDAREHALIADFFTIPESCKDSHSQSLLACEKFNSLFEYVRFRYGNSWSCNPECSTVIADKVNYAVKLITNLDFARELVAEQRWRIEQLSQEKNDFHKSLQYREAQVAHLLLENERLRNPSLEQASDSNDQSASHDWIPLGHHEPKAADKAVHAPLCLHASGSQSNNEDQSDKEGAARGPDVSTAVNVDSDGRAPGRNLDATQEGLSGVSDEQIAQSHTSLESNHEDTATQEFSLIQPQNKRNISALGDHVEQSERPTKMSRISVDPPTPFPHKRPSRIAANRRRTTTGLNLPSLDAQTIAEARKYVDTDTPFGQAYLERIRAKTFANRSYFRPSTNGVHEVCSEKVIANNFKAAADNNGEPVSPGNSVALPSTSQYQTEASPTRMDEAEANVSQAPTSTGYGLSTFLGSIGSAFKRFSFTSPSRNQPASSISGAPSTGPQHILGDASNSSPPSVDYHDAPSNQDSGPHHEFADSPLTPSPTPAISILNHFTPGSSLQRPKRHDPRERLQKIRKREAEKDAAEKAARKAREAEAILRDNEMGERELKWIQEHPVPTEVIRAVLPLKESGQCKGIKRKYRIDALERIPRPYDGSIVDMTDYIVDGDDGDEYIYADEKGYLLRPDDPNYLDFGVDAPQPTKRVRWAESLESGPSAAPDWSTGILGQTKTGSLNESIPTLQSALKKATSAPRLSIFGSAKSLEALDEPLRVRPYAGNLFAPPGADHVEAGRDTADVPTDATNIGKRDIQEVLSTSAKRDHGSAFSDQEAEAIAFAKKHRVWIGPKVKTQPGPGTFAVPDDSDDSSDEESEATSNDAHSQGNFTIPNELSTAVPSLLPLQESISGINALARARSEAEKYKPRNPSALRESSRLSSSPLTGDDATARNRPFAAHTQPITESPTPTPSIFASTAQRPNIFTQQVAKSAEASFVAQSNDTAHGKSAGGIRDVNAQRSHDSHFVPSHAAQSQTSKSNTVQSNASQSNASQSNASQFNAVQSQSFQPNTVQSNASQPNATQSQPGQSNKVQSNTVQSNASQPNAAQSNASQPNAAQSNAAQSNAKQSYTSMSDAIQSTRAQLNAAKSNAVQQNTSLWNTAMPNTVQSNTTQSTAAQKQAQWNAVQSNAAHFEGARLKANKLKPIHIPSRPWNITGINSVLSKITQSKSIKSRVEESRATQSNAAIFLGRAAKQPSASETNTQTTKKRSIFARDLDIAQQTQAPNPPSGPLSDSSDGDSPPTPSGEVPIYSRFFNAKSPEEQALLHQLAEQCGLAIPRFPRSYSLADYSRPNSPYAPFLKQFQKYPTLSQGIAAYVAQHGIDLGFSATANIILSQEEKDAIDAEDANPAYWKSVEKQQKAVLIKYNTFQEEKRKSGIERHSGPDGPEPQRYFT